MRAIILAGGYAKRLWPLTEFFPKPLLPVAGKPIINYILNNLENAGIKKIYVSTNKKFETHFMDWIVGIKNKKIKLLVEESDCEENKLGAVKALSELIKKEKINEDILIVAGDNLFDFELKDFIDFYEKRGNTTIAFYNMKDVARVKGKFGVGIIDKNLRLVDFEEKPKKPKSTLVSTGCYILAKNDVKKVYEYISSGNNMDAPGNFFQWLHTRKDVYCYIFEGKWRDIGNMNAYKEANLDFIQ